MIQLLCMADMHNYLENLHRKDGSNDFICKFTSKIAVASSALNKT